MYTALDTTTFGLTGIVLDKTGVDLGDMGLDLEQEGVAATIARAGGGFAGFGNRANECHMIVRAVLCTLS